MKPPAPSSRDLLSRMLARVDEMRRALQQAQGAAGQGGRSIDMTRATAALDDLEHRVRQMLEDES